MSTTIMSDDAERIAVLVAEFASNHPGDHVTVYAGFPTSGSSSGVVIATQTMPVQATEQRRVVVIIR